MGEEIYNCNKCKKDIESNTITFKGNFYHDECYRCDKCKTSLVGISFVEKNGAPFCKNCSASFAEPCVSCGEAITSEFLSALGSKFHPECFVCSNCKANISSGYASRGGKPYCPSCIRELKKKMGGNNNK